MTAPWKRTRFDISQDAQQAGTPPKSVTGLSNGVFGIRRELGIGFRVTHLITGFTVTPQFFRRLRDAVRFCEDIAGLTDWPNLSSESARKIQALLHPAVTKRAKKHHRYTLAGFTVLPLPPECDAA